MAKRQIKKRKSEAAKAKPPSSPIDTSLTDEGRDFSMELTDSLDRQKIDTRTDALDTRETLPDPDHPAVKASAETVDYPALARRALRQAHGHGASADRELLSECAVAFSRAGRVQALGWL